MEGSDLSVLRHAKDRSPDLAREGRTEPHEGIVVFIEHVAACHVITPRVTGELIKRLYGSRMPIEEKLEESARLHRPLARELL